MNRELCKRVLQSGVVAGAVIAAFPHVGFGDTTASATADTKVLQAAPQPAATANLDAKAGDETKLVADKPADTGAPVEKIDKKTQKATEKEADKYVKEQAKAINNIPGSSITPDDLMQSEVHKKAGGGGFPNPVSWLLRPVTRLQEQSVKLEQEITKLTGPIATLQPSMLRLDKSMSSVQQQMGDMQGKVVSVNTQMASMQADIKAMREDMSQLKGPISDLRKPVQDLREPVLALAKPVEGVESRLVRLDSQLNDLKFLLGLVLTAIFAAAAIVAVGTPIAAVLVWRNRAKLMPATKPEDVHEEKKLEVASAVMNRDLEKTAAGK